MFQWSKQHLIQSGHQLQQQDRARRLSLTEDVHGWQSRGRPGIIKENQMDTENISWKKTLSHFCPCFHDNWEEELEYLFTYFSSSPLEFPFFSPNGQFAAEEPHFPWVVQAFPNLWWELCIYTECSSFLPPMWVSAGRLVQTEGWVGASESWVLSILFLTPNAPLPPQDKVVAVGCRLAKCEQRCPEVKISFLQAALLRSFNHTLSKSCIFVWSHVLSRTNWILTSL